MTINNQVQASPGLYVNTPGQPITNNVALPQQVGLFPPNSNNQGGGSVQAAISASGARGEPALALNAYITNEGVGNSITLATSTVSDGGNQASTTSGTEFGSGTGGGTAGIGGAGGCDMNANVGQVGDVVLANK